MVHLSILEDYFLAELLIFVRHLLQYVGQSSPSLTLLSLSRAKV